MRRVQWLKDETDLAVNREILAALLRSDIEVKGDYNPKIFHQKFILRDYDGKATADLGAAVRVGQLHLDRHPQSTSTTSSSSATPTSAAST